MRLMVYNVAYGTGHTGAPYDRLKNAHKLLRTSSTTIAKIAEYIESEQPDIVGLLEVDTGSSRTKKLNQVEEIALRLRHRHISAVKYNKKHFASVLPVVRFQSNAVLASQDFSACEFHFLPCGIKQLVIEVMIGKLFFFLVHLSVIKNTRHRQILHLAKIAKARQPLIIAGDFNVFSGRKELEVLQRDLGLLSANSSSEPTFPSYRPKRELDFVLYSEKVNAMAFRIGNLKFSDHLPLIFDFEL